MKLNKRIKKIIGHNKYIIKNTNCKELTIFIFLKVKNKDISYILVIKIYERNKKIKIAIKK